MGVQTVYQDRALCDNLDAVQNLFLGRELTGPWFTGFRVTRAAAAQVGGLVHELASHGLAVMVISHDIHHVVLDNTDRIEVLRLGHNTSSFKSSEVAGEQVVNAMVGGNEAVNFSG